MIFPAIETQHFQIKLLELTQADLICRYYQKNKTHLKPWEPTRDSAFYTLGFWKIQAQHSLQLFDEKRAVRLVALNPDQTQMIASCNFTNVVWGCFYACHLGYSMDEDYQGKGLMYEVVSAGIQYMKEVFKMHRIMANHMPSNTKSELLLQRLGFEKEGLAKSYLKINGQWQDHALNSLILPSKY